MRNRWRRHPQLESLESLTLLSSALAMGHGVVPRAVAPVVSPARKLSLPGLTLLNGTAHGTFFAHGPSPASGVIYNLFASGKIEPVGPYTAVRGFPDAWVHRKRPFSRDHHLRGPLRAIFSSA